MCFFAKCIFFLSKYSIAIFYTFYTPHCHTGTIIHLSQPPYLTLHESGSNNQRSFGQYGEQTGLIKMARSLKNTVYSWEQSGMFKWWQGTQELLWVGKKSSVLDLSLVSSSMIACCGSSVCERETIGIHHYPTWCKINIPFLWTEQRVRGKWIFLKTTQETFMKVIVKSMRKWMLYGSKIKQSILAVTTKTKGTGRKKGIPIALPQHSLLSSPVWQVVSRFQLSEDVLCPFLHLCCSSIQLLIQRHFQALW